METFPNLIFVFCVLPFVVLFNAFLQTKAQNFVVLIFSLAFLFWVCSARVVGLLLFVSFFTQLMAIVVSKARSPRFRLLVCLFYVAGVVCLFSFSFWFVFANVFSNMFFDFERILFSLVCMANLSYLIDIYKRYADCQKGFINFLTYVLMFPKLFLGPVLIYHQFDRQLACRRISSGLLAEGIEYFILGFAKKVVFANEFYEIYGFVVAQTFSSLPVLTAWFGAFAGFLSFVFNFSGYSDMAIGLGKMLGFSFPTSVKKLCSVSGVREFFNRFNFLVLNYLKNYIFPWQVKTFFLCRFFKIFLIGFFIAIFFGGRVECFVAALFFVTVVLLENFFVKIGLNKMLKNYSKILTLILLLIGTVLFQNCGVFANFNYLGSMFGASGVLVDFSFVFLVMLLKFVVIVSALLFYSFFKRQLMKIRFFRLVYFYCKPFVLIFLFLFSILLNLSQI